MQIFIDAIFGRPFVPIGLLAFLMMVLLIYIALLRSHQRRIEKAENDGI